tara:strand:+ start:887 stop:1132 length:246 start_codon:yes stop_codon:yes gene_type:complete
MSMAWAVPTQTMQAAENKRNRRAEAQERNHRLKYCSGCNIVYKKADFAYKRYHNIEEERYREGTMPTYGLDRQKCARCSEI